MNYRTATELQSRHCEAVLPRQFDEHIGFDETKAISPLHCEELEGMADTNSFGI